MSSSSFSFMSVLPNMQKHPKYGAANSCPLAFEHGSNGSKSSVLLFLFEDSIYTLEG